MRRGLAAVVLGGVVLASAGCSSDDEQKELGPKPDLPTSPAEALWNPCSALKPTAVEELFGTTFRVQLGTDAEPQCVFTPAATGDTAFTVNYNLYGGTLVDIVAELGDASDTSTLSAPRLPGASGARIITSVEDDTLAVTGLVRNGRLIQVVDATDPAPFDRQRTVSAVREVMTELAAHAGESGLGGS